MRRAGFSMIELVFAIVIIAILATFAIPKLMATKDDATIAVIKRDATKLLEATQAYYYSQNGVTNLSDVISLDTKWSLLNNSDSQANLAYGYKSEDALCLVIEVDSDKNLHQYIADKASNANSKCDLVRDIYGVESTTTGSFTYDFINSSATGAKKRNYIELISTPLGSSGIKWQ